MEREIKNWHQGLKFGGTWEITKKSTGEKIIEKSTPVYSYDEKGGLIFNFKNSKYNNLFYEIKKIENLQMPPKLEELYIEFIND